MDQVSSTQNYVSPSYKKTIKLSSLRSQKQTYNFPQQFLSSLNKNQLPLQSPNPRILLKSSKQSVDKNLKQVSGIQRCLDQDKLLEITSRCIDYYNSFMEEKDVQIKIVKERFTEMHRNLNQSFHEIISDIKNKHNELKQFLNTKQNELFHIKQTQQSSLTANLTSINSIHLQNLLKCNTTQPDSEQQLCNYANTLHRFYETMESVQKINFKDNLEEVISFASNVINQEILAAKSLKLFGKEDNANLSFSFNDVITNMLNQTTDENLRKFSSVQSTHHLIKQKDKQMIDNETQTCEIQSLPQTELAIQFLCDITKKQQNLHNKISAYKGLISNRADII